MPSIAANQDGYTFEWLTTHGVRIAGILALAVLVSWLASAAVRRFTRRLEGDPQATAPLQLRRRATLASTMGNAVRVVVWTVVVLLILGELGLNLAPLLAGAGVVGVALGFGAQSLVRDFLSGFFILLEDQFGVGDVVEITAVGGTVTGTVESLTLRTTTVRAADGTLSVIPNGNVQLVSNKSRGRGRLTVDVRVPHGEDLEDVARRLEELLEEIRADPAVSRTISWGPTTVAIEPVDDRHVVLRVVAETRPHRRDQVEAELRRRIQQRFLPTPHRVAVAEEGGGPTAGRPR